MERLFRFLYVSAAKKAEVRLWDQYSEQVSHVGSLDTPVYLRKVVAVHLESPESVSFLEAKGDFLRRQFV